MTVAQLMRICMTMHQSSFRDLEAWQRAMDFAEACYRATETFPASERYGLTGQIRRAAVSIPSNVAEGKCRRSVKAFAYHVGIALGSEGEIEAATVGRLLSGLHRSLENSPLLRPSQRQSRGFDLRK